MKNIEEMYNQLLEGLIDDNLYDLIIEYKTFDGETIRFSWRDRENRREEIKD